MNLLLRLLNRDTRTPLERDIDRALAERKQLRMSGWQRRAR